MRRYQRGVIVALLGVIASTFVKFSSRHTPEHKEGGWRVLSRNELTHD